MLMHLKIQNQYWFEWGQVKQSGWPHIITNTDCICKNQNLSAKFYKYKTTKGRNTNSNEWSASASAAAAAVGRRAAPPVYWRSQLWTQSILQTPFGKCKITNYKYKIPIQKYTCQKYKFKQLFIEGPMLKPSLFSKIYKTPKFQTMYFVHNIKHRIKKFKNANTKRKRNNILKYKFKQANFEPNYFELVLPIASVRQKHVTLFAPLRHRRA